jgi:hypothetical protein
MNEDNLAQYTEGRALDSQMLPSLHHLIPAIPGGLIQIRATQSHKDRALSRVVNS